MHLMRGSTLDSKLPVRERKNMGIGYRVAITFATALLAGKKAHGHLETSANGAEQEWMRREKMSNGVIITIIICLTLVIIASMGKK